MGVEYVHGLFVVDWQWRPEWKHVDALQAVLERWKLSSGSPRLLTTHAYKPLPIERSPEMPANLKVQFAGSLDRAVIERVMGPSETRGERRLGVVAILGVDFRVQLADSLAIELVTPPTNGNVEIERDDSTEAYPSTWSTTHPYTLVTDDGFTGVWRSGILLYCGKDVPRFQERTGLLPDPALRDELEHALGTELVEAGWIE